jgi:hypothetical protein
MYEVYINKITQMDLIDIELNMQLSIAVRKAPSNWPSGATNRIMAFIWIMSFDPTRLALAPLCVSDMLYETIWLWTVSVEEYKKMMYKVEAEDVYQELVQLYEKITFVIRAFCMDHKVPITQLNQQRYDLVSVDWKRVKHVRNIQQLVSIKNLCVYGWMRVEQTIVGPGIDPHQPVLRAGSLASNPLRRAFEFM